MGLNLVLPVPVAAQGDLLIAPTRLVLDGRRGGEVILSNVGAEEATYRVSLELRRMTPEGSLEPVDSAEANIAEAAALEMIRYAPRRVVLPPGEPQAIRISARPGADLPDGEYRVHMSFAAIPKVQPIAQSEDAPADGFVVKITPIYGITMPIIVRKGQLEVVAGLANPRIEQTEGSYAFAIDISRSGDASLYGDLLVYGSGSEPVFVARGLGVYPEIGSRHTTLPISADQAAAMHGQIRVEFREPVAEGGVLIASLNAVLR
ncbi:molecular chaperone [Croceibacterium sp. LX-88]|uniref:Molecular chaperone n=1 Tax=Croceibacterium selenioxidans TaxID=2838833 RepID=A0ABS5W6D5_9SPHN|nr:molecular chaperone [Croceibacterium selenioxidans]